jgi:hypothetical protein
MRLNMNVLPFDQVAQARAVVEIAHHGIAVAKVDTGIGAVTIGAQVQVDQRAGQAQRRVLPKGFEQLVGVIAQARQAGAEALLPVQVARAVDGCLALYQFGQGLAVEQVGDGAGL